MAWLGRGGEQYPSPHFRAEKRTRQANRWREFHRDGARPGLSARRTGAATRNRPIRDTRPFRARHTGRVYRGLAVSEHEWRSRTRIFCGWHRRRHHHRPVTHQVAVRDRPQFQLFHKGKALDLKQIGHALGVRYLVEGSVRKAGGRVRITAQLIDAQTSGHLWAERYDRLLDDIFGVQDEITMSVIGAIEPNLRKVEIERVKRKRPDNLDAYDLVLRALPFVRTGMVQGANVAIPLLKRALELEPEYAWARALLAQCFHFRFSRGGLGEADRVASTQHARAATAAGSDDATTLAIAAMVIWFDGHDGPTAFELFDCALAVSNSNVVALSNSAFVLAWMGNSETAIERAQRAIKLSPFDTSNSYLALAVAHFHSKNYENSRDAAQRAVEANPAFSVPRVLHCAALMRVDRRSEAIAEAQRVRELDPTFTIRNWSVTVGIVPEIFSLFADALRDAGIPDE